MILPITSLVSGVVIGFVGVASPTVMLSVPTLFLSETVIVAVPLAIAFTSTSVINSVLDSVAVAILSSLLVISTSPHTVILK